MGTNRPTACIIGSGFGGISLAIRLQGLGYDVTIFSLINQEVGHTFVNIMALLLIWGQRLSLFHILLKNVFHQS